MLAATTKKYPFDWEEQVRKVCMAYNTSVLATTGYTPLYLMFWRETRLPADLMFGHPHYILYAEFVVLFHQIWMLNLTATFSVNIYTIFCKNQVLYVTR